MDQTLSTARPGSLSTELRNPAGLLTFLFLLFWLVLCLYQESPPAVVAANAPAAEFASGRAVSHLQVLANQPHPIGSTEHGVVRDYIFNTLAADGLRPAIQTTTAVNRDADSILLAGTIQDVMARLPGTSNTRALLIAAHYDSKAQSFGASDDGAGVAAMLETLRALKSGPPLRNDVIFLFTDCEEEGLLGSNAFINEHPWARDVGMVLNFEARGSSGPSIMFETSRDNGWLVQEFAKAAPHPVANSLSSEIYKLLPNTTDFSTFAAHGLQGLNFAYIDGFSAYHTLLDNRQTIDERSLQHHGSYALALARHFGNLDLQQRRTTDRVYFDLFGTVLVNYAKSWVLPLSLFALLLFVALLVVGLRLGLLTVAGVGLGAGAFLLTTAVVAGVESLLWLVIFRLRYALEINPPGVTYYNNIYLIGFAAVAVAITVSVYNLLLRKMSAENLAAGALVWWVLLMLFVSFYLPGASYLLTWPLIFAILGLAGYGLLKYRRRQAGLGTIVLLAGVIPGLTLLVPLIYQLTISLTFNWLWLIAVVMLLALGLLVPHLAIITRNRRWLLPGAAALIALCCMAAPSLIAGGSSAQRPKFNSLFYALNSDTGQAWWASVDPRPDDWTRQFLSAQPQRKTLAEFLPTYRNNDRFLQNTAPATALSLPQVEVIQDEKSGDVRTLRLRLKSTRGAPLLGLFIDSKVQVLSGSVNEEQFDQSNTAMLRGNKERFNLRYLAAPPEGVLLGLQFRAAEPLKIRVVDQSYGLTQVPGFTPRPDSMIPWANSLNDATLVCKSLVL